MLPIRRRVRCTTRLPHDVRSVDRPGILATDVRRFEIYSGMCSTSDLWTSKHSLQLVQLLKSWSHTVTRLEIQNNHEKIHTKLTPQQAGPKTLRVHTENYNLNPISKVGYFSDPSSHHWR